MNIFLCRIYYLSRLLRHDYPLIRRVIENVDEWIDCIDCNTGKVVSWDFTGYIKEDYSSFDDYLMDQMKSAIENM